MDIVEKLVSLKEKIPPIGLAGIAGVAAILGVYSLVAPASSVSASSSGKNYLHAKWDPIHFKPAIDKATNEQCLSCHKEILEHKPRKVSPAGLKTEKTLAWYQTLDTYKGSQQSFHARHLTSEFSKQVMDLKCNFCHQGNDPREEIPVGSSATGDQKDAFTLRKMVNPSKTCLRCHGSFPKEKMTGITDEWHKVRGNFEYVDDEDPEDSVLNGCLVCHKDQFRTNRHMVTYLKGENIEKLAKKGSDVCYGCHGGRSWYSISYPYPRNPWPNMKDMVPETPKWAHDRPTQSEARYRSKK